MSVRLTPYSMKEIDYYEISRGINCHDKAVIRGEMSEAEVAIFQSYLDSSTVLSLYYSDKELPEGSAVEPTPKSAKYSMSGSESTMGFDFIAFLLMAMQMSALGSMEIGNEVSSLESVSLTPKKTIGKNAIKKKVKTESSMHIFDAESSKKLVANRNNESFKQVSFGMEKKASFSEMSSFEDFSFEAMPQKKNMTIHKFDNSLKTSKMFDMETGKAFSKGFSNKTMASSKFEEVSTLVGSVDSSIRSVAPEVKSHNFKAKSFSSEMLKSCVPNTKSVAGLAVGMGVATRKTFTAEAGKGELLAKKNDTNSFLSFGDNRRSFLPEKEKQKSVFSMNQEIGGFVQKKEVSSKKLHKRNNKSKADNGLNEFNMLMPESNMKGISGSTKRQGGASYLGSVSTSGSDTTLTGFEEATLVFAGVVSNFKVLSISETWYVEVELKGITSQLDYAKVKKDYQSATKTVSQIVDSVFESYQDTKYLLNGKDDEISEFLLQYEESDYHFLQRVLSRNKDSIYTNMKGREGIVCLGVPEFSEKEKINPARYELEFGKTLDYRIQTEKFYDIGDCITAFGKSLYVKEVSLTYKSGEYVNSYLLTDKEGMQRLPMVNEEAVGVSLDGTVMATNRDKVQIELSGTAETPENERRWFSYASPASSSDGSGWYCMPKDGEQIRLYCPTEKESEAYVISAIKSGNGDSGEEGGGGRNTQDKILSNDAGQCISFTEDGVSMFCADGAAIMLLKPEGTIEIFANNDINIGSTTDISIKCDQNIAISAAGTFNAMNETGSEFVLTEDIAVHANRIRNNG